MWSCFHQCWGNGDLSMGTAHGADDSPPELQVGQKIPTPHPPYLPLDLWSKQCAILLGSGPGNRFCARTQSLYSMTWPYPCHQHTWAGYLVRGDTPRYVPGMSWCSETSESGQCWEPPAYTITWVGRWGDQEGRWQCGTKLCCSIAHGKSCSSVSCFLPKAGSAVDAGVLPPLG